MNLASNLFLLTFMMALAPAGPGLAQDAVPSAAPVGRMVFFDWAKPELSGDAKTTLDRIAAVALVSGGGRVRLEAHTDRSGSAEVNLRSARRRAAEVRDYLIAKGVAAGSISITSFGESRPLIPTADGVREVQNRRVEIILDPAPAR